MLDDKGRIKPISTDLLDFISNTGHTLLYSIYGQEEDAHDYITHRKGSYQNLLTSVQRTKQVNVPFEFNFVPVRPNFEQIEKITEMAKTKGAERISILRFIPQGRGEENKEELDLSSFQLHELVESLSQLNKAYGDFVRLGSPFNGLEFTQGPPCASGKGKILVTPEGNAHTCEAFKQVQRGINLSSKTLEDFLRKIKNTRFLELFDQGLCPPKSPDWRKNGCIAQTILREGTSNTSKDSLSQFRGLKDG